MTCRKTSKSALISDFFFYTENMGLSNVDEFEMIFEERTISIQVEGTVLLNLLNPTRDRLRRENRIARSVLVSNPMCTGTGLPVQCNYFDS